MSNSLWMNYESSLCVFEYCLCAAGAAVYVGRFRSVPYEALFQGSSLGLDPSICVTSRSERVVSSWAEGPCKSVSYFRRHIYSLHLWDLRMTKISEWLHLSDALSKATYSAFRLCMFCQCVFPGNWTYNLCTANTMLYHWATGSWSW